MRQELPELVELDNFCGADFVSRWKAYIDCVYRIYLREVANGQLTFMGLNVSCRYQPMAFGKHYAFWHMMQEGPIEDDRTADLERCKRVRWIAWVITAAGAGDPRVKVFPQQKRGTEQPWALWMEEERYVVILWERNGYYLLKTAFPATKPRKIAELKRDWERYNSLPQKG